MEVQHPCYVPYWKCLGCPYEEMPKTRMVVQGHQWLHQRRVCPKCEGPLVFCIDVKEDD